MIVTTNAKLRHTSAIHSDGAGRPNVSHNDSGASSDGGEGEGTTKKSVLTENRAACEGLAHLLSDSNAASESLAVLRLLPEYSAKMQRSVRN